MALEIDKLDKLRSRTSLGRAHNLDMSPNVVLSADRTSKNGTP